MARPYPKTDAVKKTEREKAKAKYHSDPEFRERAKAVARLWRCGFTQEHYDGCRKLQQDKCAICTRLMIVKKFGFDRLNCDHDHATGEPRGLLCSPCNSGLGMYEKRQREMGVVIEIYDNYLADPPVRRLHAVG